MSFRAGWGFDPASCGQAAVSERTRFITGFPWSRRNAINSRAGDMGAGALQTAFDRSVKDPSGFWGEAAEAVYWHKRWEKVLDDSHQPFYRWFVGAEVNTCYNALDVHVEVGRGDQPALIYDSPVTNCITGFTYRELRDKVARFAGALAHLGIAKGDRVILYMPMIPEAVVAMLACARLGAIHSVVFGSFAANELATRIDDAEPKAGTAGRFQW